MPTACAGSRTPAVCIPRSTRNQVYSATKCCQAVPGEKAKHHTTSSRRAGAAFKMFLVADRVVSSAHASTSGRPIARPAVDLPRRISRSTVCEVACGGLKKQTKKLAKTLKTHRKRLETMLASAVTSPQETSQMQLQAVLAEMAQLQDALQSIRALQEQHDSSDSDSDSDGEHEHRRRPRQSMAIGRANMVVAAAAVSSRVLEPPPVDQEMPDITQQLPPPQQYSTTGRILVCQGKACMAKGGLQVIQAASHAAAGSTSIEVIPCKCLGKCKQGPAMRLRGEQPGCTLLTQVSPLEVPEAVEQVFGSGSSC